MSRARSVNSRSVAGGNLGHLTNGSSWAWARSAITNPRTQRSDSQSGFVCTARHDRGRDLRMELPIGLAMEQHDKLIDRLSYNPISSVFVVINIPARWAFAELRENTRKYQAEDGAMAIEIDAKGNGVSVVTLAGHDAGNFVYTQDLLDLAAVLTICASGKDLRALVVTGRGNTFCGGRIG